MNTDIDEGNSKQFKDEMKEEILPRRVVLRGALAVGCGLLLPAALFGCDSKKGENASGAAPAGSPASGADAAAPASTGKMAQASVQYQAQPKGEQKCAGCLHFIAESNACKLVEGQISPDGWCTVWTQKA
jgi:High potential iron-sulfur protein